MSTNSLIGREIGNNKVEYIYCHWDGYLEGVGEILRTHYLYNQDKINELFKNGNLSSLGREIDDCEFYKNRGDENWESQIISKEGYMNGTKPLYMCQYRYLFTWNDRLVCYKGYENEENDYEIIKL